MNKRYLLLLLFSNFIVVGYSQTLPQFTQYIFNQFYINPGAAGQFNKIQIQSTVRSQYTGYTATEFAGGGNLSSAFSIDMPLAKLKGGVGLQFANQNISKAQSKSEATVSYSFHKRINSNVVGIGVGVGLNSLNLNGDEFIPRDPNDPFIPESKFNSISPQLNFGIYLLNPSYQIGISTKNILESGNKIGDVNNFFKEPRQYYLTGKYDFGVSYTLDISPMFLIRSDIITTTAEIGLLATYKQKFWVGANYRNQDAGSLILGANILENKLKLGYAIDIVTSGAIAKSNTSHELFLRYILPSIRSGKKSIIKTPRYNIR